MKINFHSKFLLIIVICVATLIFLNGLLFVYKYNEHQNSLFLQQQLFTAVTDNVLDTISNKVDLYTLLLLSGKALFETKDTVSRSDWHTYTNSMYLPNHLQGTQGFGYIELINLNNLNIYTERIKAEGFHDFKLKPAGKRSLYTSVTYIEPFNIRNQQSFGFDMFSEEVRREAMETARDTGKPQLSGKVTLTQETNQDVQPGFLIYLPLYKKELPLTTIQERNDAIQGYVYSPFRASDFIQSLLNKRLSFNFAIFSGEKISEEAKLFDTSVLTRNFDQNYEQSDLTRTTQITIANHVWTIYFSNLPDQQSTVLNRGLQSILLPFGIILNCIIVFLLFYYLTTRSTAKIKYHD
jgi:CHASE1-domain containing sensor protein